VGVKRRNTWTEAEIQFLRDNYRKLSFAEIGKQIGKKASTVKSAAPRYGVSVSRRWADQEIEMVKLLYSDTKASEIAEKLDRGISQVYRMAQRLGLQKSEEFLISEASGRLTKNNNNRGEPTRFRKGHRSWNKGKKIGSHPNSVTTQFKKGQRPHNWVPVGTEVMATIGYLKVKIAEPNVWEFSHHKLWREYNGEIPEDFNVCFKDRDRTHVVIENLELISREEWMERYTLHNYPEPLRGLIHQLGGMKRRLRKYAEKQNRRPAESAL
jgi:hypothetical protein